MKFLIVLSALLAVALAKPGFLGAGVAAPGYVAGLHPGLAAYGPANIVIGPGGVPLNTPEVAAARAAHLSAVAQTRARDAVVNGAALAYGYGYGGYAAPLLAAPAYAPSIAALAPAGVLAGHGLLGAPGALAAAAHLQAKAALLG